MITMSENCAILVTEEAVTILGGMLRVIPKDDPIAERLYQALVDFSKSREVPSDG